MTYARRIARLSKRWTPPGCAEPTVSLTRRYAFSGWWWYVEAEGILPPVKRANVIKHGTSPRDALRQARRREVEPIHAYLSGAVDLQGRPIEAKG